MVKLDSRIHKIPSTSRQSSKKTAIDFLISSQVIISPEGDICRVILISDRAEYIFCIIHSQSKNRKIVIGGIDFIIRGKLGLQFRVTDIVGKGINEFGGRIERVVTWPGNRAAVDSVACE